MANKTSRHPRLKRITPTNWFIEQVDKHSYVTPLIKDIFRNLSVRIEQRFLGSVK